MQKSRTLLAAPILLTSLIYTSPASAVTPPYAEGFETEPTCSVACAAACVLSTSGWTNAAGDDLDWAVDIGGTGSPGTGPSVDHTLGNATGRYLYTESSSPCNAGGLQALLISPPLELLNTTLPVARFWYHMFGATQGTLHVDVLDSNLNVLALDIIPSVTDNVNLWQQSASISLAAYVGQTVHIRIRGILAADFTSDMAIDDFSFVDVSTPDLSITSIDSPLPAACGLTTEQITLSLANAGAAANGFNIAFNVDGGAPVSETSAAVVPAFGTATYTFTALGDFSVSGAHTLSATVTATGDANPANNSITGSVFNGRAITTFPASENFEGATAADWVSGGTNSTWALGTPANTVIAGAASGANSWVTNLTGLYNNNEQSFVRSNACYQMTALANPALQMSAWWESENSYDGANVQYSIDGGANWVTIGTFGDPINWYNDDTINGAPGGAMVGWTGRNGSGSPGWVPVIHELAALTGAASVNFRVNFGSDGSVPDDGFAFDDVMIFDNNVASVEVAQLGPAGAIGAIAPGTNNLQTQELLFLGYGIGTRPVTSLTITNAGTIPDADITAVRVHLDNGDGIFDSTADTLLGSGTFSNGITTITTIGLDVPSLQSARAYVSVDVGTLATAGAFISTEIANPVIDIVTGDASPVTALNALFGPLFGIQGSGVIPVADDFTIGIPARTVQSAPGVYPGALAAGTTTTLEAATTNSALIEILPSSGTLLPSSGTGFIAIAFPNGRATGAVDYLVDLSTYDATIDPIWMAFRYTDTGEESDPEDNVFLSLDGGATWFGSLYRFTWTAPQSTWTDQTVDISGLVASGGGTFTSSVVIRFQAQDDSALGLDGLLIDSVLVGEAQSALVERPIGTVIADDAADLLGTVPPIAQAVQYTVRNEGHFPLVATATITAANNVTISGITGPLMVAATSTDTIQIDYTPGIGAFDFVLSVAVDDPRNTDGTYTVAVSGTAGTPEADIDVQRPAGTTIASGGADAVGNVAALSAETLTYTVVNFGLAPLMVTGVTAGNGTNVTLTQSPYTGMLTSGQSATFDIGYTTMAAGAFGFDVTVQSNDADEGSYVISVTGDAVAPEIEIERGGNVIASGDTDTQPRADLAVPVQLDYEVFNRGTADLTVSGVALANLMSVTASVTTSTAAFVLAPNTSATVGVQYVLTAPGTFGLDVVVNSDDTDEAAYTIVVAGESTGPDISVTRGGAPVANAGTDDLGMPLAGEALTLTYTIANDGTSDLTITTVESNAEMNAATTVTQPGQTVVAAGGSITFTVEYTAAVAGAFSFGMSITSDDPDESPYTYVASGTATVVGRDGGMAPRDGGDVTGDRDAGVVRDAGPAKTAPPREDEGCSCEATTPKSGTQAGSALVLAMIGGVLFLRRRR